MEPTAQGRTEKSFSYVIRAPSSDALDVTHVDVKIDTCWIFRDLEESGEAQGCPPEEVARTPEVDMVMLGKQLESSEQKPVAAVDTHMMSESRLRSRIQALEVSQRKLLREVDRLRACVVQERSTSLWAQEQLRALQEELVSQVQQEESVAWRQRQQLRRLRGQLRRRDEALGLQAAALEHCRRIQRCQLGLVRDQERILRAQVQRLERDVRHLCRAAGLLLAQRGTEAPAPVSPVSGKPRLQVPANPREAPEAAAELCALQQRAELSELEREEAVRRLREQRATERVLCGQLEELRCCIYGLQLSEIGLHGQVEELAQQNQSLREELGAQAPAGGCSLSGHSALDPRSWPHVKGWLNQRLYKVAWAALRMTRHASPGMGHWVPAAKAGSTVPRDVRPLQASPWRDPAPASALELGQAPRARASCRRAAQGLPVNSLLWWSPAWMDRLFSWCVVLPQRSIWTSHSSPWTWPGFQRVSEPPKPRSPFSRVRALEQEVALHTSGDRARSLGGRHQPQESTKVAVDKVCTMDTGVQVTSPCGPPLEEAVGVPGGQTGPALDLQDPGCGAGSTAPSLVWRNADVPRVLRGRGGAGGGAARLEGEEKRPWCPHQGHALRTSRSGPQLQDTEAEASEEDPRLCAQRLRHQVQTLKCQLRDQGWAHRERQEELKGKLEELQRKQHEADVAVAPLKAKLASLVHKCLRRNHLITRLLQELGRHGPVDLLLSEMAQNMVHDVALSEYAAAFLTTGLPETSHHLDVGSQGTAAIRVQEQLPSSETDGVLQSPLRSDSWPFPEAEWPALTARLDSPKLPLPSGPTLDPGPGPAVVTVEPGGEPHPGPHTHSLLPASEVLSPARILALHQELRQSICGNSQTAASLNTAIPGCRKEDDTEAITSSQEYLRLSQVTEGFTIPPGEWHSKPSLLSSLRGHLTLMVPAGSQRRDTGRLR
uniref:uncharacterized protein C4orf50 homolog isoform X6 n=1 Tax=Ictidomys tridecemlineatus TaxID=43179 RepID=UPI001A9ED104|nr:uncharacterized protein C4orf50 homolog isoform X6 [Ictidomys tridecemlineatus]